MANFEIDLETKPALSKLMKEDTDSFREIVGSFVNLMELAAKHKWHELPQYIHTSLSFKEIVTGVLNAVMTTKEIEPDAYVTLEQDLHPLSLLSDKRKNFISGERENYDWMNHFALDSNEISQQTLEKIIRKMLYLVRWFDIEEVSKALIAREFPINDPKDMAKLPFQPALTYQREHMGELYVGKFFHDIGAFNCGTIVAAFQCGNIIEGEILCPACGVGELEDIKNYHICTRCNAGFETT
jgi:hypothetical protein